MREKILSLTRLKRAALLVLLLYAVGRGESLAQNQVAILQHGEETTAFYGINAFVEAHEAAESGDIITLSSGNFVPTDITKGITLRGAGCVVDSLAGTLPTIIGGSIDLDMEDESDRFSIEGILFTNAVYYGYMENPTFIRCNLVGIYPNYNGWMTNAQFINCFVSEFDHDVAYGTQFVNCVVWQNYECDTDSPASFVNSILGCPNWEYGVSATNSIIVGHGFESTCSFVNCIGIQLYTGYSVFGDGYALNCSVYSNYNEVFETFNGTFSYDDPEPFTLTDEAANFETTDGTQVGIHGGPIPYTPYPNYMVRSQVTVAPRSTIDGQLNIEVEVIEEGE